MSAPQATDQTHAPTALLILGDGTVLKGRGLGAEGKAVGEVCFNTSMTGYQEIMTDPSYAGQIINFTFPHIGNVGANDEDIETVTPAARGCVLAIDITEPSSWRAAQSFDAWLKRYNLPAIAGIDTRRLTRRIRDGGAPNGVIVHRQDGKFDVPALIAEAKAWPGLEGMDLAKDVSCRQTYHWDESLWALGRGYGKQANPKFKVVAIDYGAKRNILRCLTAAGCDVTVVPATATTDDVLRHQPDGVFLANGPGDPAATGEYAVPVIKALLEARHPDLRHLPRPPDAGARPGRQDRKDAPRPPRRQSSGQGPHHRQGRDHQPEPRLLRGARKSAQGRDGDARDRLFDGCVEGLELEGKPVFSVQYHPEASPGPMDCHYLFHRFVEKMEERKG